MWFVMNKQFRIYKSNSQKNGTAMSVDINKEKQSVFLEFAKQKPDDTFDWEKKLTMKLSLGELAKICVLYKNKTAEVTLFHDPSKGEYKANFKNAILKVSRGSNNYYIKLNQQELDGNLNSILVNVTEEEMYSLCLIFDRMIQDSFM